MPASMFVPIVVNDGVLVSTNVPNEYPTWSSGGSYTAGDRVVHDKSLYELITTADPAKNPAQDPEAWVRLGASNPWRPFDGSLGQEASNSGTITYTLVATSRCDALAFVNVKATSIRVVVKNTGGGVQYDQTRELLDTSDIATWTDYFTYEATYEPEQVFTGLPMFATFTVEITIDGTGGTASVGEIVLGREVTLGEILPGSRSGFTDYTSRQTDEFGNIDLVVRPTARKAEWQFAFETRSNRRIQRELEKARGRKCFFYPGEGMSDYYLSVFGVPNEFYPSLSANGKTIDVLSLTGVS